MSEHKAKALTGELCAFFVFGMKIYMKTGIILKR